MSQSFSREDQKWMRKAVQLAERGRFAASPNPMVGACVVHRGRWIASGFHKHYGADHAEFAALKRAGKKAKGATLYVTLEPCSTWGKTPPCVASILDAGIRRVVIAVLDPNPKHFKKGLRALKRAGVRVQYGLLEKEVRGQNQSFFKWVKTRLPFITLKMAQTLDGKIATRNGKSRWISSPASRRLVHRLRAEQDAVLIGKNTLSRDNPKLSPRLKLKYRSPDKPWRVVLDPRLEARPRSRIFQGPQLTIQVTAETKRGQVRNSHFVPVPFLRRRTQGRILLPVRSSRNRLDLKDLLQKLGRLGVAKLLVEGGGEIAWTLLRENLVDKLVWIVAPKILGGRNAKTSVEGEGFNEVSQAIPCEILRTYRLGEDWVMEARPIQTAS